MHAFGNLIGLMFGCMMALPAPPAFAQHLSPPADAPDFGHPPMLSLRTRIPLYVND